MLFCATFSSFIKPTSFDLYFKNEWKLPWRFGTYYRTSLVVNPNFRIVRDEDNGPLRFNPSTAALEPQYSQKATHIKHAAQNSLLYVTTTESMSESNAFHSGSVDDSSQSPVVFQAYGKGYVGYLGDVNGEVGTVTAILVLCGLKGSTEPPKCAARSPTLSVGGFYCSGCGKQETEVENGDGDESYKRCGKCKVCYYCSSSCQRTHWNEGHKKVCRYMGDDF